MISTVFLKSTVRPFAVGQPAIVHHLQQHVEHIRMRLLDLVEQNHRIRPAPHSLSQLTALVVAHISRRRANQPRHGVLLHVLAHVDAHHRLLIIEQKLRQRARRLRFAHARRSKKDEEPIGRLGSLSPARERRIAFATTRQRRVLSDHALAQPLFHLDELLHFAFEHLATRECRSTC